MLFDTHCHINYFDPDEIQVILKSCLEKRVFYLQNISVELSEFDKIVAWSKRYPNICCSIGAHPCNLITIPSVEDLFKAYDGNQDYVTSVGETGLDYYHDDSDDLKSRQKQSMVNHIDFATKINRPLIFHVREAGKDFAAIATSLMKEKEFSGVMHCFSGDREFLYKMLDLGFYISLAGIVTFKNAVDLQNVSKFIPMDRLLLETDSPYLAPSPMRGKKNEPSFVYYIAQFLSHHLGMSFEDVCQVTTNNASLLFKVPTVNTPPNWFDVNSQ